MLIPIQPRFLVMSILPKEAIGAELGVFRGEFSNMLLRNVRPTLLHLIDTWQSPAGAGAETGDMIHASVLRRFAAELRQERVEVHRATAADALDALADDTLDFIYLSGERNYEVVLQNLRVAGRKVKSGGLVCGTDYVAGMAGRDGVLRAVHDFLVENKSTYIVALLIGTEFALRRVDAKMLELRAERKVHKKTIRAKRRRVGE